MDRSLQDALHSLNRHGNCFGAPAKARARWTEQLNFRVRDARKEAVRYLWFVGDYASYDPRVTEATCAAARVFHKAGLDFGILYDSESNAGNDVRLVSGERLYETLRDKNLKAFAKARFDEIVTTDPHSFQVLRHEYAEWNGGLPVRHHTQLLSDLISGGELPLPRKLNMAVTYHDPCYLGRYNAIFGAPRHVIAALGLRLVEMPQNKAFAYCCGGGAGRIWMDDPPVFSERPAITRVREAALLKGVRVLVVVCPKDLVMFQDAIRTLGLDEKLEVRELSELVEQAME